jgi:hypothetical protein
MVMPIPGRIRIDAARLRPWPIVGLGVALALTLYGSLS